MAGFSTLCPRMLLRTYVHMRCQHCVSAQRAETKITEVTGIKVDKMVTFKLPQIQEYLTDGAEIWCGYNTLDLTKFNKNLEGGSHLSFIDLTPLLHWMVKKPSGLPTKTSMLAAMNMSMVL